MLKDLISLSTIPGSIKFCHLLQEHMDNGTMSTNSYGDKSLSEGTYRRLSGALLLVYRTHHDLTNFLRLNSHIFFIEVSAFFELDISVAQNAEILAIYFLYRERQPLGSKEPRKGTSSQVPNTYKRCTLQPTYFVIVEPMYCLI